MADGNRPPTLNADDKITREARALVDELGAGALAEALRRSMAANRSGAQEVRRFWVDVAHVIAEAERAGIIVPQRSPSPPEAR